MVCRFLPALPGAILVLALTGCATTTPAERAELCRGTDWLRYGVNDGKLGVPPAARADAFAECARLGAAPDQGAYDTGRAQGLASYCTVENGYRVGYEGRRYHRVCPPTLEPDFLQGFNRGRRERPAYRVYPRVGIGIGTGGVRTGVGLGVGTYWGRHPGPYTPPYWCGFWIPDCR